MIAPIKITSRAVEEILNILETKGIPREYSLRVSIKSGHGCSGTNFTLGFDKKKELDTVSMISGIKVLIQKSEIMFLLISNSCHFQFQFISLSSRILILNTIFNNIFQ